MRRWIFVALGVAVVAWAVVLVIHFWPRDDEDYFDAELAAQTEQANLKPSTLPGSLTTDWPQWLGPWRNGISAETAFCTDWPSDDPSPLKLWERPIGKGYSSLAVLGNRVYTMSGDGQQETVLCLDADTGAEIWKRSYPCVHQFTGDNDYGPGPRSTPTIDGDRVYTVGITGIMYCRNALTGEPVWSRELLTDFGAQNLQWGVSFSPLVLGGLVYANPGQSSGHSLVALDKMTGEVRWHVLDDVAGYSSPVAAEVAGTKQIIFFTGAGLVGVAPDTGAVYWRFPLHNSFKVNAATPVVVGDYVFASSAYEGGCVLLKIEATGGDSFRAKKVYRNKVLRSQISPLVYHEEHLFGIDGTEHATMKCLKFATSEVCWKTPKFGRGSFLLAGDYLIVLSETGYLALVEANPAEFKVKAGFQALEGRCWTMPVLAGGRLYLRNQERILCMDLRLPPKK
jgi:hypothetical protein